MWWVMSMADHAFTPALDHEETRCVNLVGCRDCQSILWHLTEDGQIACPECKAILDGFHWLAEESVQ